MSEVTNRLKETSENCISSYEKWAKDMKDESIREELQGHIHELRKVASRLEIEIAMSERDQMKSKRIPIPPHRSAKQNTGKKKADKNDNQETANNNNNHSKADNDSSNNEASAEVKKAVRRGRKPKAKEE